MKSTLAPAELRKTPLNATHRAAGARMAGFGGWDMPVEYSGIIAEHMAVRTAVGLFDVSHMGEIEVCGPLAEQNLAKAHYLAQQLEKHGASLAFTGPFFNEFVVRPANAAPAEINRRALESKIVGGLELGRYYPELDDCMLVCATEMNRRVEMDLFAEKFAA